MIYFLFAGQTVALPTQQGVFVRSTPALGQVHTSQSGATWQMESGPNGPLLSNPHQNSMDPSTVHTTLQSGPAQGPNQPGGQKMHYAPIPAPPNPPEHPTTEQERQQQFQYEQWLYRQERVLDMQLKGVEGEVHKLRKQKKVGFITDKFLYCNMQHLLVIDERLIHI